MWNEWIYDLKTGWRTFYITRLIYWRGRRVDLHKIVRADSPGCYHTHPAKAFRLILWGGYVEELEDGRKKTWQAGQFGMVPHDMSHRFHAVLSSEPCYTLWIRGRITHDVALRGTGWPDDVATEATPHRPVRA